MSSTSDLNIKEDCECCCDTFNKSTRKRIVCYKCNYEICRSCVERHTLNISNKCNCMNCHMEWTLKFMMDNLTKTFITHKYRVHRENIIYDMERIHIPGTMVEVERLNQIPNNENKIEFIKDKIEDFNERANKLRMQLRLYECRIWNLQHNLHENYNEDRRSIHMENYEDSNGVYQTDTKYVYNRKCPGDNGECQGFLNDKSWKCGICSTLVCAKCNSIKNINNRDEHVCKDDDIETMKLLRKDTKPCPKCGKLIYKISGCNHMMCTECHTSFQWNTGELLKGNNTNPHYYEWLRVENNGIIPRNPGDNPYEINCEILPHTNDFLHYLNDQIINSLSAEYCSVKIYRFLQEVHQIANDINTIGNPELDRMQGISEFERNRKDRVKFLTKQIDEETYKTKIFIKDREYDKTMELGEIKNTFYMAVRDILNQMMQTNIQSRMDEILTFIIQLVNLINYINQQFIEYSRTYMLPNIIIYGINNYIISNLYINNNKKLTEHEILEDKMRRYANILNEICYSKRGKSYEIKYDISIFQLID
jgi:hypothetical protein